MLRTLVDSFRLLWSWERTVSNRSWLELAPALRELFVVPLILLAFAVAGGLLVGEAVNGWAGAATGLGLLLVLLLGWSRTVSAAKIYWELTTDLEALRQRSEAVDIAFRVEGPEPIQAGDETLVLFMLTATNRDESRRASVSVRLRVKLFGEQGFSVPAEGAPIRAWEEYRANSPGGPSGPLGIPFNLPPAESRRGYVGFPVPRLLKNLISARRTVDCALEMEDLLAGVKRDFWTATVATFAFGVSPEPAPTTPPTAPQSPTASEPHPPSTPGSA